MNDNDDVKPGDLHKAIAYFRHAEQKMNRARYRMNILSVVFVLAALSNLARLFGL